jgi:predicted nucleic acid-binding protein
LGERAADGETPILVVDTGVAAKWYLNEDLEEEAARVLDAGGRGEARLVAPDSIGAEFFNVLWQHHVGHRGDARPLSLEEVRSYWQEFTGAPVELFRAAPLTRRAVEITVEVGVIVYDALFLALAEVGEAVLVTADEKTILRRIKGTPYEPFGVHLSDVDALIARSTAKAEDGETAR